MSCAHCEELAEEVAYLKTELAFVVAKDFRVSLREKLGLETSEAAVVEALYAAKGRVVDHSTLMDALPTENDDRHHNIIKVYVCRIRSKIGRNAIRTVYSEGYGLTPEGLQTIAAVLA